MGGHIHAPYPSKSATQDWQRQDKPLVKSESLAKTNWRTGELCDVLHYKRSHKFGGKLPSPIPAIAHRSNTHKLYRQDAADPGAATPSPPPPFRRPGPPHRSGRVGSRACLISHSFACPAQQQGKPLCFYFPAPRCGHRRLPGAGKFFPSFPFFFSIFF